jgi:hypothetical protein
MKNELLNLTKPNERFYSDRAVVIQTYRVKDQLDLFNRGILKEQYNAIKHLTCDVRLTKDGTIVYGVKLSPHILKQDSNGSYTEIIYDGTIESPSGDIPVQIPLIGSYVFINWLDRNNAFVALQTNSESIIVGSTQGAYFDFYNNEETKILDLKNADEFNVALNNGKVFNIKTDSKDYTTFLVLLERIILSVQNAQIIIETDDNGIPLIKLETDKGKISICNEQYNLKDILLEIIDNFISYINKVSPGLILADATLSNSLTQTVINLNELKNKINLLLT